jgi:hypothetical protein
MLRRGFDSSLEGDRERPGSAAGGCSAELTTWGLATGLEATCRNAVVSWKPFSKKFKGSLNYRNKAL